MKRKVIGWCGVMPKSGILKPKRIYKKRMYAFKKLLACRGGPLSAHRLMLSTPGTMAFTLCGHKGYYNHKMEWIEL